MCFSSCINNQTYDGLPDWCPSLKYLTRQYKFFEDLFFVRINIVRNNF